MEVSHLFKHNGIAISSFRKYKRSARLIFSSLFFFYRCCANNSWKQLNNETGFAQRACILYSIQCTVHNEHCLKYMHHYSNNNRRTHTYAHTHTHKTKYIPLKYYYSEFQILCVVFGLDGVLFAQLFFLLATYIFFRSFDIRICLTAFAQSTVFHMYISFITLLFPYRYQPTNRIWQISNNVVLSSTLRSRCFCVLYRFRLNACFCWRFFFSLDSLYFVIEFFRYTKSQLNSRFMRSNFIANCLKNGLSAEMHATRIFLCFFPSSSRVSCRSNWNSWLRKTFTRLT